MIKDSSLKENFPIREYYLKKVYSRGGKYTKGHPINDRLVLCPLHEDLNPSMGFITRSDGTEIYHCFGCGSVGTVLQLEERIEGHHDDKRGLRSLCELFGVDYEEFVKKLGEEPKVDIFAERMRKMNGYSTQTSQAVVSRELRNFQRKEELNAYLLGVIYGGNANG